MTKSVLLSVISSVLFASLILATVAVAPAKPSGPGEEGRYLSPIEMASSPDGHLLYVVCEASDELRGVDIQSGKVINSVCRLLPTMCRNVRIGVLGLFHPRHFTVSAPSGHALVIHAGEERIVLERSSGVHTASIRLSGNQILLQAESRFVRASALTITGRKNEPVDFTLAIPKKIARRYYGTLEIHPSDMHMLAIVTMDRKTAVASIVAAESTADTPPEAIKAQAVATRSYLVASPRRHRDFDFCDTTHCQFLREPPASGSAVAKAVAATRDLILAYRAVADEDRPVAAMYTRSCSGRTHTPAELGLPATTYPYYSVECKYCRAHPARWSTRISAQDAAPLHPADESSRLKIVRRLGWNTVPSNDFIMKKESGEIVLEGTGQGHGIGLCQSGAKAMAADGATFRQILSHYYPNTTIVSATEVSPPAARSATPQSESAP